MNEITSFKGEYEFLSNFFPAWVKPYWWPFDPFYTNEHLFQACKVKPDDAYTWLPTVAEIHRASTPGKAKFLGGPRGIVDLRDDWEEVKVGMMRYCVQLKFRSYAELADLLLSTGDAKLIEGNRHGDRFWGAVWDKELGWVGHNWLGHLLMEEREATRNANS